MAYLLTHFWPGGTEEQCRATIAVVHPPNGLPDGQVYHAAGPTEGAFLIAAVWDSKETPTASSATHSWQACRSREASKASRRSAVAQISNLETI
jgi:hypothetical protein